MIFKISLRAKAGVPKTLVKQKLEWWMIFKISLRAKAGVPKTLVKQKLRLHSLYFPQSTLC